MTTANFKEKVRLAKKISVKNLTQEEQAGTDPVAHGSSEIGKRKDAQGMCTCVACVHLCLHGAGEERRTLVVKGFASVLKVLEEIHTCSDWVNPNTEVWSDTQRMV